MVMHRPPVDEDFSIAAGRQIAPESCQFGARLRRVVQTPGFNDRQAAMLEDNPLVVGSLYPLPVWSTVTLKFIDACDDRVLNRQPGAKTESPRNSAHLTRLAWINSQERKPFYGCGKSRTALVSLTRSPYHLATLSAQSLGRP